MTRDDEQWRRVREVFDQALELAPDERAGLFDLQPPDVRREVERLLEIDAGASAVLERGTGHGVAAAWAATPAPGQEIGPYRLIRALGSGGMGVVFEAEEASPRRRVALKTVRAELFTPELLQRFANEVQMLARLEHPGIARIYSSGAFERAGTSSPYYTMELVEDARTILAHADRAGLDGHGRIQLFLQACDAVEHGHHKGVIHRDLKPGNLLVDPQGRLKVIDFGLARPEDPVGLGATPLQTKAGLVFGTLPYMSPEHVSGRPLEIDTQSDVYSLGCILCELLAGRPPHDLLDTPIRTALERIEREVPRLPPELPRELGWIVGRAVARERERRYATVGELGADLRRYLRREPVLAAPPSRTYALRSFARRHRRLLAAVTAVVIALGVGLARARVEARAARDARDDARREAAVANEVSTFLGSLFTGMHAFAEGADARVSDVLGFAASRIEGVERADSRAILTGLIGQGHLNLGDLESAEPYISGAVELASGAFPPRSIHRLRIEMLWADWLEQAGRYEESRDLSASILARDAGVLEEHDRFYVRYNLALCESRFGRHGEAQAIFRDMLAHELETTASGTRVINLTHRLAAELWELDRVEEGVAAYRDALARCGETSGSELYAATIRMELASVHHALGELEEAEQLLDLASAAFAEHDSPPGNRVLCELTRVEVLIERDALDAAAEALAEAERLAGELHGTTRHDVYVGMVRARLQAATGRLDAADETARSALELASALTGPDSALANQVREVMDELAARRR